MPDVIMENKAAALLALAARCEAASGPDRELDAEIAAIVGRFAGANCERYSASLDAALSLMLPEVIWDVTSTGACWIDGAPFGRTDSDRWWTGKAATPSLAACAAALRARAALA